MEAKQNIRQLDREALGRHLKEMGEPAFRLGQVWDWLWAHHARTFEQMSNLPKRLRDALGEHFSLPALVDDVVQESSDGTVKTRFRTYDGHLLEGVLIPTESRQTACVSSQAGCSLSCRFCATGFLDRKRNLHFDEIYDEVAALNRQAMERSGKKLTNIVFMGMGEPLLNYRHLLRSVERITAADGLAMSPRRITVSTAGIAKQIRQLGDDGVRFNLALSLHAPTDKKRSMIMPINESNPIAELMDALAYFYAKTKNEITFEYILFKDLNDSEEDARELIRLYRRVPVKVVNLIEYNPIGHGHFARPEAARVNAFMTYLAGHRVNARLRRSRGKDIDAACGQLANKG